MARREVFDSHLLSYYRTLRRRGLRLAIVTNGWGGPRQHLSELGLVADFDEVVISAEVGIAKPKPAIFKLTAERLGVSPSECIYVDDQLDCIVAASQLGMTAIQHTSAEGTIASVMGGVEPAELE